MTYLFPHFEGRYYGRALPASPKSELETFFSSFRDNIIGQGQVFESPYGEKRIIYADWTASGRAYRPIESCMQNKVMPFVANTHTSSTITGTLMSQAYEAARSIVKGHVNANSDDALVFCGSGMTSAVNKLQRILGMRIPERVSDYLNKNGVAEHARNWLQVDEALRPIVFLTHMEHHSNQVSWLETIADVELIRPADDGNVDLDHFRQLLEQFKHRKNKIAAVTACSNVTGIQTPYHEIAKIIHARGGLCFVDFACSAPYVNIDMHPRESGTDLDAIYFSPHKFLGGPGSAGVLVFHKKLYKNKVPDQPGGGTLSYSNPWKVHRYETDIEQREDGGTPPFLQAIKAAMCTRLKEKMGVEKILKREEELLDIIFSRFSKIGNVEVLEGQIKTRLGVVSFIVKGAHYSLIVRLLNDRFGVQARGGCSCAGTYGHHLLRVDMVKSHQILNQINSGDLSCKPGWTRLSIHPTMTNAEVNWIMNAIELTAAHFQDWAKDYAYDAESNEYFFKGSRDKNKNLVEDWFNNCMV